MGRFEFDSRWKSFLRYWRVTAICPAWTRTRLGRYTQLIAKISRLGRRLFNLLVGFVFLILGLAGAIVTYDEWRIYQRMPADGPVKVWVVACFTFLLLILGLYSFAKARSVR